MDIWPLTLMAHTLCLNVVLIFNSTRKIQHHSGLIVNFFCPFPASVPGQTPLAGHRFLWANPDLSPPLFRKKSTPPTSELVVGTQNAILIPVTTVSSDDRKQLRMVTCAGCGAKVFIPGDLQPLTTTPCSKCGFQIMMPMRLRQFELRAFLAAGGMGTVYRAFDTVLER